MAKWVDYTNKFGFGMMLRNGVRCVVFNDDTVCSTVDAQMFVYHAQKQSRACTVLDLDTPTPSQNPQLHAKCQNVRYVRNYMDQELNSAVPLEEVPEQCASVQLCRQAYVMDVAKFEDVIVFTISDGSVQVREVF